MKNKDFQSMNKTTIHELNVLNASCGFVAIISNGNLIAVVEEEKASEAEETRRAHGC